MLAPLAAFAESLGYSVSFEPIDGSAGGFCDRKAKRMVVEGSLPANAQPVDGESVPYVAGWAEDGALEAHGVPPRRSNAIARWIEDVLSVDD